MLEFLKLAFATQGVAQGAEEFLRLLNEVEEDGHAFKNTEGSPLCTQLFRLGLFDLC